MYDGAELGDERFRPFFAEAAALGLAVLVHPLEGYGFDRITEPMTRLSLGVLSDTAVTASSIFLSGLLRDVPDLRLCLSHGAGTFYWALPRMRRSLSAKLGDAEVQSMLDAMSHCYVDTASLGAENLSYLETCPGHPRLVIGSDFPAGSNFDPRRSTPPAGPTEPRSLTATH